MNPTLDLWRTPQLKQSMTSNLDKVVGLSEIELENQAFLMAGGKKAFPGLTYFQFPKTSKCFVLSSGGNDVNNALQNVANQQVRSPNEIAGGASGPGRVEPQGAVDRNTNIQQQPNIKQRQQLGMNQPQEQGPPPSMQGTPPLDPISEPRPTQGDEPGCSSVITSILKKRESENSLRGKPAKVRKTTKSSAPAYAITLGVVSRDDNQPHFTLEEGDILKEAIIDYVVRAFDQELRPSFYDILNREGFLIVHAQHENSAKWLLKHAEGIRATCNLPFKVVEGDDIPNSCLMHGFFLKAHKIEDDTILTFLEAQNYDMPARRWKIVKKIPSNEGATCTISMDLKSVEQVKKENFILCYRAGHVRLQPINPVGMLVEEPAPHIAGISPKTGSKPKRARRAPKKSKLIETSVLKHLDPITADGKGKPKEEGVTNGDNKANPKLGNLSPGPPASSRKRRWMGAPRRENPLVRTSIFHIRHTNNCLSLTIKLLIIIILSMK